MDVKFIATIECRVDNIGKRRSQEEIERELEALFEGEGIHANVENVEVSELTYVEQEDKEWAKF